MDNSNRDVRRFGASRFSFPKRQSIKQSGTVTEDEEMGCVGSDGEDEIRPTTNNNRKRFKLSKKFLDECNNVDHSSVPRKLRSAMKKRRGGSVSPPLPDPRKVNHMVNGIVLPTKNGTKKSKLNVQQGLSDGSPKQVIIGSITRDEEEVVETLFALAGMFSGNDKINESSKLDGKLPEPKSAALPESSTPANEDYAVLEEEADLQTNHSSSLKASALETEKVQSVNESSQAILPNTQKYSLELDNNVPQVNASSVGEPTGEGLTCHSVSSNIPPKSKNDESPASVQKLETALEPVPAKRIQLELQPAITDSKNNGLALWHGLSTTGPVDAVVTRGPPLQSSAAKLPAWLGNASCSTEPCSSKNHVLTERDSRVEMGRKNSGKKKNEWKRCSAHVYISHLIKVFQIKEGKDSLPVQPTTPDQLTTNEGSMQEQEAPLAANNIIHEKMNSSLNGVEADGSSNEVRNAILLHKRLLQDQNQKQVPTTSGLYTSQKQNFDFMAISSGDYGVQAVNCNDRAGNRLESSTPFHVPYLHSVAQNHATMPISVPLNHCYSSTSFPNHLSTAAAQQVQVQLPPYLCSPFSGPSHMESPVPSEQQHQQLQRVWAAQQVAQYRPGEVVDPTHLPCWQNGRQGPPSLIQYAQTIFPPNSHSSLEVLGPNYATISPQQQFISLLSPSRAKRQHHLPSGYEGKGASPLQLLCNNRI
ncbi:hypothetical protein LguiA_006846 [Lonicera macranthoides]